MSRVTVQKWLLALLGTVALVSIVRGEDVPGLSVDKCIINRLGHQYTEMVPGSGFSDLKATYQVDFVRSIKPSENSAFVVHLNTVNYGKSSTPMTYVVDEVSVMKTLNDEGGDKNLVTAIANFGTELTLSGIATVPLAKNVAFRSGDYKGATLALEGDWRKHKVEIDRVFTRQQDKLYNWTRLATEMEYFLGKMPPSTIAANPRYWRLQGAGSSIDEANVAARFARSYFPSRGQVPRVLHFGEVRGDIKSHIERLAPAFKDVATRLDPDGKKGLFAWTEKKPPILLPSLKFLELFRKHNLTLEGVNIDNIELLKRVVREEFGVEVHARDLLTLVRHIANADLFSPGIYKGTEAAIQWDAIDADIVGSVDIAGMGARNLLGTIEAVARGGTPEEVLIRAREEEKVATEEFEQLKREWEQVMDGTSVQFSGDDGAYKVANKSEIVQRAARSRQPASFRIAFTNAKTQRHRWIARGEDILKEMRLKLRSSELAPLMKELAFGMDMQVSASGTEVKAVFLLGWDRKVPDRDAMVAMLQAFKSATEKVEKEHGIKLEIGFGMLRNLPPDVVPSLNTP